MSQTATNSQGLILAAEEGELLVQQGAAVVSLGTTRQTAKAGGLVFIPENEWIGVENTGSVAVRVMFIFSSLGFDEYLRATSVPEGQPVTPISPEELGKIRQRYRAHIAFKEPR